MPWYPPLALVLFPQEREIVPALCFSTMARRPASFRIIDARTGLPLPGLPSFPSFSAAHKESGHVQGSVLFPLSVGRF